MDTRDLEILKTRQAAILACDGIGQGDLIRFTDGVIMTVAHVWEDHHIQPAFLFAGSLYLGNGYMSFSGSLEDGIDFSHFTPTNETMTGGRVWFFHHDYATAGGGIDVQVKRKVWNCDTKSPEDYRKVYRLTQITPEYHERTCNYWYLVTLGGTSHTAFTTEQQLNAWLSRNKLRLTLPLVKVGEFQTQRLESK